MGGITNRLILSKRKLRSTDNATVLVAILEIESRERESFDRGRRRLSFSTDRSGSKRR